MAPRLTPDEAMSAGRAAARKSAPYFAPLILLLVMRAVPGLASGDCLGMAVTVTGFLLYDPDAIVRWTTKQLAGVLIHEVLHIWLRHFARMTGLDPDAWNRACDRAINPIVLKLGLDLPGDYLMPRDIGMPDGLSAIDYYEAEQKRGKGKGQPQPGNGKPQAGQGQPKPGEGRWGKCGSGAGNPVPGEPTKDDPQARASGSVERATKQAAEALNDYAAKHAGRVPGELARHAPAVLAPPKVPWQRKLATIVRRAVQWRPGAHVARYDGMNRRQGGIGYGLGRPILARLREPVCNVAVVLDTSGSMGSAELGLAMRETRGVLKALHADVTFVACDTRVHSMERIHRVEEAAKLLKGGGGTSFAPAFEALAKAQPKPEVVIFLTDGYGDAPETQPAGMTTIWVLVGSCTRKPCSWGDSIEVKD
jgi:predicted metal-dependent peptidase